VSDIDTVVVDSLKVLDPERPIRETTKMVRRGERRFVPITDISICSADLIKINSFI